MRRGRVGRSAGDENAKAAPRVEDAMLDLLMRDAAHRGRCAR